MEWFSDKFISTGLSVFILGYLILAKVSERKFRMSAVPVTGQVVKRFPRQHYTSYYVAYHREGIRRVAEWCGPPARILFDEGDTLEILIDPSQPPDTPVPDKVSSSGSASGNCSLVGESIWKLWDFLYLFAAIGLLLYTYSH
ncbi:MAG TPA: hypothetical protein VFN67_01675 [Polyangiales bacterium]|nr:hypothetical protein [Polyangiales bacterium]